MVYKNEQNQAASPASNCFTFEQMNIITNSIKLWMEYAFWMRALINSTISQPERQTYVAGKLFNGVIPEFYTLFEFYYGAQLAKTFMTLFTNFTTGIWGLVTALKSNNKEEINKQTVQLYHSADELANFLARINAYYSADQWKSYFYEAIRLVIDEATSIISKNFAKEVEVSDSMANLVMSMGDYMSRGILAGAYPTARTPPAR